MKKISWFAWDFVLLGGLTAILMYAISGCTFSLKDQGEIGFRQSTSWGFYHTASQTHSEAQSKLESPSLVEWLFKDEKKAATVAEPAVSAPTPTAGTGVPPGAPQ